MKVITWFGLIALLHTGGAVPARCHDTRVGGERVAEVLSTSDFPPQGVPFDPAGEKPGSRILELDGVPSLYLAGHRYTMSIIIREPNRLRSGWQVSVRSTESGKQAGRLIPGDDTVHARELDGVVYLRQALADSDSGVSDGPVVFRFDWIAPNPVQGNIHISAACNVTDEKTLEGGTYIYAADGFSVPSEDSAQAVSGAVPDPVMPLRMQETSRVVNLPVPMDLDRGSVEIRIEHRFFQAIENSSPGNAFGIDFGANISLGLNYALTDRLSAGVSRTRLDQIVSLSGTYELRTAGSFWNAALHGGVDGQRNFSEHYSPFLQFASAFDFRRFRLHVIPTMVFNSRMDPVLRTDAINPDDNNTFSLGLGTDVALHPRFSLQGEYVARLAGFGGFEQTRPQLSGGIVIRTYGHVFAVMLSTSRDFTPAKYAVNAENRDFSLGFNIYRKIR